MGEITIRHYLKMLENWDVLFEKESMIGLKAQNDITTIIVTINEFEEKKLKFKKDGIVIFAANNDPRISRMTMCWDNSDLISIGHIDIPHT